MGSERHVGRRGGALKALTGASKGTLIRADIAKVVEVESTMPKAFARLPWAGHIGLQLMDEVAQVVDSHQSTLIFTNTRRQAEVWYHALLAHKPEWAGILAMHHGSIAKELREWVEDALHDGRLRAVVCTASLDLGVDFRPVDAVVQIGGPKGVSRMIQRAGRSGHRPGAPSKAHFVPTHGLELLEAVALREAIAHGEIEPKSPIILCWDVLVQWLCTLAVSDGFDPAEVQSCWAAPTRLKTPPRKIGNSVWTSSPRVGLRYGRTQSTEGWTWIQKGDG